MTMLTLLIIGIIVIVISIASFLFFKSIALPVSINANKEENSIVLNINASDDISDIKIIAYAGKDVYKAKRQTLSRGDNIRITYNKQLNVKRIKVEYKLRGEKHEWEYKE